MKTSTKIIKNSEFMKSWDEFYAENYQWALKCITPHESDFDEARRILDRIFLNLTLDPMIDDVKDQESFKSKLSIKLAGVIGRINREKRRMKINLFSADSILRTVDK